MNYISNMKTGCEAYYKGVKDSDVVKVVMTVLMYAYSVYYAFETVVIESFQLTTLYMGKGSKWCWGKLRNMDMMKRQDKVLNDYVLMTRSISKRCNDRLQKIISGLKDNIKKIRVEQNAQKDNEKSLVKEKKSLMEENKELRLKMNAYQGLFEPLKKKEAMLVGNLQQAEAHIFHLQNEISSLKNDRNRNNRNNNRGYRHHNKFNNRQQHQHQHQHQRFRNNSNWDRNSNPESVVQGPSKTVDVKSEEFNGRGPPRVLNNLTSAVSQKQEQGAYVRDMKRQPKRRPNGRRFKDSNSR